MLRQRYTRAILRSVNNNWLSNIKPQDRLYTGSKIVTQIPGPKFPVLWSGPSILCSHDENFMMRMQNLQEKYGNIVKIRRMPGLASTVLLFNPDHFDLVHHSEGTRPRRAASSIVKHHHAKLQPEICEKFQGLRYENGREWEDMRYIVNQAFFNLQNFRSQKSNIDKITRDFVKRNFKLKEGGLEIAPELLMEEIIAWLLQVNMLIILGKQKEKKRDSSEIQRITKAIKIIKTASNEFEGRPLVWRLFNKAWCDYESQHEILNSFLLARVKEASSDMTQKNTCQEKLFLIENILAQNVQISRATVLVRESILAAVVKVSRAIQTMIFQISRNPVVQERLREELRGVLPHPDSPLTSVNLQKMTYLTACVQEVLRLSPVDPIICHVLEKDVLIDNYLIQKGTEVMTVNSLLQVDPNYFPQPTSFIPERWLKEASQGNRSQITGSALTTHSSAFLPFGSGPRHCPGEQLTTLLLQVFLARVVRNFRISRTQILQSEVQDNSNSAKLLQLHYHPEDWPILLHQTSMTF